MELMKIIKRVPFSTRRHCGKAKAFILRRQTNLYCKGKPLIQRLFVEWPTLPGLKIGEAQIYNQVDLVAANLLHAFEHLAHRFAIATAGAMIQTAHRVASLVGPRISVVQRWPFSRILTAEG